MKKRILSIVCSLTVLCSMFLITSVEAKAEGEEQKQVDGSYLTHDEESHVSTRLDDMLRGKHLMDGDSIVSNAGKKKIYAYGQTTANHDVDYIAVLVYVDRYHEDTGRWGQVDAWSKEEYDTYYVISTKYLEVDGGYYYRVRSEHFAGNEDERPYDSSVTVTDGIWID